MADERDGLGCQRTVSRVMMSGSCFSDDNQRETEDTDGYNKRDGLTVNIGQRHDGSELQWMAQIIEFRMKEAY